MEPYWKDLDILRTAENAVSQALVEGGVPLPDGRGCSAVLDSSSAVAITSCTCASPGQIQLEGWVNLEVLCEGTGDSGDLFTFSSRAAFRHTIESEAAVMGAQYTPHAWLQTLDLRLQEGAIQLSAIVNLGCHITHTAPLKALESISGVGDLQVKERRVNTCSVSESAEQTLHIREEISAPGIASVISASGAALLKGVQAAGFDVTAAGLVNVALLCSDGKGALKQINHSLSFTERLDVDITGASLFGEAEVMAISARSLGEEFGIVAIELQLKVKVFGTRTASVILPLDAYSLSMPFECTYEHAAINSFEGQVSEVRAVSETLAVPDGMPEVGQVVFVSARPLVTDSVATQDMLSVEGILFTRVLYRSADSGPIYTFSEEVPFMLSLPAPGATMAEVNLHVCAAGMAAGANVGVEYTLMVSAKLSSVLPADIVSGIAECGEAPARASGLVVCFAGDGEDIFDIAKRFGVTTEALLKLNPAATEVLQEGDRMMLLI